MKVLLPSIGVGLIFFFVMRSLFLADRRERAAMEEYYAQADAEASDPEKRDEDDAVHPYADSVSEERRGDLDRSD